jgi:hypothetical protein
VTLRILSYTFLIPALACTAVAEDAPFLATAHLVEKSGAVRNIRLVSADGTTIRFLDEKNPPGIASCPRSGVVSVGIDVPAGLREAMNFYRARRFPEALAGFVKVREQFKPIDVLEDNPSTLAGFYQMECLRQMGDLEGLAGARRSFVKEPLTRAYQLRQLELDEVWESVHSRNWDRVETLAKERATVRLPGDQRAQVAYCQGLALEGLNRPEEALSAYDVAMIADAGASEEIARQAALRVLAIHLADPEVQAAMKLRDAGNADKTSPGWLKLTDAAGVARLFQLSLGAGTPLPTEFAEFLKDEQGR